MTSILRALTARLAVCPSLCPTLRRLESWATPVLAGTLAVLGGALGGLASAATKPFENTGYSTNLGFSTKMSTIAGLTDWAADINYIYGLTTWITVVIFFLVAIPVMVAVYKFRAGPDETDEFPPKQIHGHAQLEFLWTIIPCILLVLIAIPTWKIIFRQAEEPKADALQVEVIGHQFWWEFRYPQLGITTANELSLPEKRQIHYTIRSADVIHSFWVPQFGGKVDAIPGDHINTMTYTTPALAEDKRIGGESFQGQCVELCGLSHALMRFNAILRTADEFDRWAKAYNTPPVVATEQQRKGQQAFTVCAACHTIGGTDSEKIPGDKIGPNLSNFGTRAFLAAGLRRNTPENLALWLTNPGELKPGALMPNLNLAPADIAALSAYLRQSTAKTF